VLASFAVQGVARQGPFTQVIVSLLLSATLILALWAAEARRSILHAALLVVTVVVIWSVAEAAAGNVNGVAPKVANLLLVVLAPPAVVVGVVRSLRARHRVTVEVVFGSLCLYILLGMMFAVVYGLIARASGSFFSGGVSATTSNCLYFSFTTLTTVGYGDYTAASNLGHTLSVTEGLVGQLYLVTVVSVVVANLGRSRGS
jgi:hypothetical protein